MKDIKFVNFDALEFQDVQGKFRLIRGCSLPRRQELGVRLNQLFEILESVPESETIQTLYDKHQRFRYICDRCLSLCGVNPAWIDTNMLSQLLFAEEGKEGLLIQLNFPHQNQKEKGEVATYAQTVAALWTQLGDLKSALEVIESYPAQELLEVMEARAELYKSADPKAKEEAIKKEWRSKARADLMSAIADTRE